MDELSTIKSQITPIIITGMSHSGKSLPAGLLSVYYKKIERVKEFKFNHILVLRRHGRISDEVAKYLFNNWLLNSWHDYSIGRNFNFRRDDETSIWSSLDFDYQLKKCEKIKREKPTSDKYILLEPHNAVLDYNFLKKINSKILFINIYRSPIDTIYAWVRDSHYSDAMLNNPYSQIITLNVNGKQAPLIAEEFAEEFVFSTQPDRCFLIYESLYLQEKYACEDRLLKSTIINFRFEELLVNPESFFSLTNAYFGKPEIRDIQRVMQVESVPREISKNQKETKLKELKLRISSKFHDRLEQLIISYNQILNHN